MMEHKKNISLKSLALPSITVSVDIAQFDDVFENLDRTDALRAVAVLAAIDVFKNIDRTDAHKG